jgi:hypothetical protein
VLTHATGLLGNAPAIDTDGAVDTAADEDREASAER